MMLGFDRLQGQTTDNVSCHVFWRLLRAYASASEGSSSIVYNSWTLDPLDLFFAAVYM